jgi:hypothetical protein
VSCGWRGPRRERVCREVQRKASSIAPAASVSRRPARARNVRQVALSTSSAAQTLRGCERPHRLEHSLRRSLTLCASTATLCLAIGAPLAPLTVSSAAAATMGPLPPGRCGPPADTVPPQITSLTLNRSAVDVANGPNTVVVTAGAVDTSGSSVSGVRHIKVSMARESGRPSPRNSRWRAALLPTARGAELFTFLRSRATALGA